MRPSSANSLFQIKFRDFHLYLGTLVFRILSNKVVIFSNQSATMQAIETW